MDGIVDSVLELIESVGYAGIFLGMLLENIFPPFPSEAVLGLAGVLVSRGELTLWGAVLAATAGIMLSAVLFYGLGYYGGRPLIHRYGKWLHISEEDLAYTERWFAKYGGWVVFFGRFLPIIRTLISIPAGITKMHFGKFLLLSTIPSIITSTFFIWISKELGDEYKRIAEMTSQWEYVILGLALIVLAAIAFWYKDAIMRHFFPMQEQSTPVGTDTSTKEKSRGENNSSA